MKHLLAVMVACLVATLFLGGCEYDPTIRCRGVEDAPHFGRCNGGRLPQNDQECIQVWRCLYDQEESIAVASFADLESCKGRLARWMHQLCPPPVLPMEGHENNSSSMGGDGPGLAANPPGYPAWAGDQD